MRVVASTALIAAALVVSCGSDPVSESVDSKAPGAVVVYVHWNDQGLADTRVEIVELGQEMMTDGEGLAEFVAPAGRYTVRAYNINRGGPGLHHVDTDVIVHPHESIRVEIVNCLPCV